MDIFSFLAIVFVTLSYLVTSYLKEKSNQKFFDKIIEQLNKKEVVTFPWQDTVEHPENQIRTDDQVPLEELDEDDMKKNIAHMFTTQVKDEEAEEAQKEVN